MDDFDRLALAAAHEVMQSEHEDREYGHLRVAAEIVLRLASERGWQIDFTKSNLPPATLPEHLRAASNC